MIKAVFFDLYHTLIRYEPPREESLARVLNEMGMEVTAESLRLPLATADEFIYQEHARWPIGKRSDEEKKSLWAQYQAVMLKEAGLEATREVISTILGKMQQVKFSLVLFDDVLSVLNELKKRELILGLISNVDSDISPLLQKLGLTTLLDIVITSQDCGYAKPQPEIFNQAAKQAGIQTQEAIYIGDQYQIDIMGASQAGMKGILLDRNGLHKGAVQNTKIQNLHQLVEYLP